MRNQIIQRQTNKKIALKRQSKPEQKHRILFLKNAERKPLEDDALILIQFA